MAKTVSKLSVKAVMDTASFNRGVDDMTRKLDNFRKQNARSDSRTSASQKTGGGRWTDDVKSVSKDFKTLSAIVKVGGSIQAGMDSLMVATKLWKGDIEGAQQAIEGLPFGIGALAKGIRELREEWGLMPQAWKDSTKLMEEAASDQEKINEKYASFVSMKERVLAMDQETAAIRAETTASMMGADFGGEYMVNERKRVDLEKLGQTRDKWMRDNPNARPEDRAKYDQAVADQRVAIEERAANEIADIIHKRKVKQYAEELEFEADVYRQQRQYEEDLFLFHEESRQKQLAADIAAQETMRKAEDEYYAWAAEEAQKEFDRAKENAKVAEDTAMMGLRAKAGPGADLEMQRAQSAMEYERRIKEAREEGNTGLVKQLELQQRIADIQIRKDNLYRGTAGMFDPRYESKAATFTGTPTFAEGANTMNDPEVAKAVKDIAVTLKKMGIQLPAE